MADTDRFSDHPLRVVERIIARHGRDLVFTYSRYAVAAPGQQAAARRTPPLRVSATYVGPEWLAGQLAALAADEELAWHSYVDGPGGPYHIPMIDFIGRQAVASLHDLARAAIGPPEPADVLCFETGQSYHGYGVALLPLCMWHAYLGRLLLLNAADAPPVVDARWVGHALVRGFSALRWSHKTDRYLSIPRLVCPDALHDSLGVARRREARRSGSKLPDSGGVAPDRRPAR